MSSLYIYSLHHAAYATHHQFKKTRLLPTKYILLRAFSTRLIVLQLSYRLGIDNSLKIHF